MKLVNPDNKDWQQREGYSKKVLLDDQDLNSPGNVVQLIKIEPGDVAKLHHHLKTTEIFYFFEINGTFEVNGEIVDIKPGSVLMVEPGDKHEVTNTSNEEFTYLVFKLNYEDDDLYWD